MALDFDTTTNRISAGDGPGIELDPGSTEIVTINNGVLLPDGTKVEPAIRFSDDNNTGLYSPDQEQIGLTGNGELVLKTTGVSGAVNYVSVVNATTGSPVIISADGTDTNIDVEITPKGTGVLKVGGVEVMKVGDAPTSHSHVLADITDFDAADYATGAEGDLATTAVQPGDNVSGLTNDAGYTTDAAVAVNHYTKTESDAAYATAAQGTLADSATQPGDNVSTLTNDSGFIDASGVTYENLNTNGDVGTGAAQVAAGDHNHTGVYEPADATILKDADIGVSVAAQSHVHEGTEIDATGVTDGYVLTADGAGNAAWEAASGGLTTVTAGDIDAEASTDGQVLTSDGAGNVAWEDVPAGGSVALDDLTDVVITTPSTDQVLSYNGTNWVNATASGGGGETYFADNCDGTAPSATGTDAIAIGEEATCAGAYAVAVGKEADASNSTCVAVGWRCDATGDSSLAIGRNCNATGNNAIAIGYQPVASANYGVAIGASAEASAVEAFAFGFNAKANHDHSQAYHRGKTSRRGEFVYGADIVGWGWGVQYLEKYTTDDTTTEMNTTDSGHYFTIADGETIGFTGHIIARVYPATTNIESMFWKIEGMISRAGSTTTLSGGSATLVGDNGTNGWTCTLSADSTNHRLVVNVTGDAVKDVVWIGRLDFTQYDG